MNGSPRAVDGKNIDSNFREIWRDVQPIAHTIVSSKPADSEGVDGEIRVGTDSKLYVKFGGAWFSATLT